MTSKPKPDPARDAAQGPDSARNDHQFQRAESLQDRRQQVLETSNEVLTAQISELAVGQMQAARERQQQSLRMTQIEDLLAQNTAMTAQMLDVVKAVKGGIKVLGWIGVGAKWLAGIAAAVTAIYTLIYMATHGGSKP